MNNAIVMNLRMAAASTRFGLGRKPEEPLDPDPVDWLRQQLAAEAPYDYTKTGLAAPPSTAAGLAAFRADRENKPPPGQGEVRRLFRAETEALLVRAVETNQPFRERLVRFWANHFNVAAHGGAAAVCSAFIEEAIRPHVTGQFQDMLLAVIRHPAMLLYLDNARSIGPNSAAGQRRHLGLNENLARECLELHTVTLAAGYTQADVTNFAAILTGWSIDLQSDSPGFRFRPMAHEPGPKTLLGWSFPPGEEGGVAALSFLAHYPTTYRALATKLVRHFVADNPPAPAVQHIEGALGDSGGDLGAAAHALLTLPEAWAPLSKLRSPQDYAIAALRALDLPAEHRPVLTGVVAALGQPMFGARSPQGWPDGAEDWAAPEAVLRRVDWGYDLAGRAGDLDPEQVAETAVGQLLQPGTLDAMRHAGSRRDALALLFASPEFQRR